MGQLVKVGTTAELEDLEAGKLVEAGGQSVAIFNLGGTYYAIENTCPHRGGPLAEGMMAGEEVICPWHGSCFHIKTGACPNSAGPTRGEELSRSGRRRRCGNRNRIGK